jgi:type I restriction enzyme S subunit
MSHNGTAPKGWRTTTLGSLGTYVNGRAFKSTEWSKTGRPIIRIQDLTGSNNNPNYFAGEVEGRHVVHPGDLLISWSASLGAYLWAGPEGVLNQHIFKVQSSINKRFHYHLARAIIADLQRNSHGSGIVHVTKGVFEDTVVAIPDDPLLQERLADFIDGLETLSASALHRLASGRRILQLFRRAVLRAASYGGLTDDWRDSRAHELVRDIVQTPALRKSTLLESSDFPPSWLVSRLEDIAEFVTDGDHNPPKRVPLGIPHLTARNIRDGSISLENCTHISRESFDKVKRRYDPRPGDVIVTCVGTLGETAIVPEGLSFSADRNLAAIRPKRGVASQFLKIVLDSPEVRNGIQGLSGSTAQPHLYLKDLRALAIPIPSIAEQIEIARRVDLLLSRADLVRSQIDLVSRAVENCAHSVLMKTFEAKAGPARKDMREN